MNNRSNRLDPFQFDTPREMDLAKHIYKHAQKDILNVVLSDLEWQQKNKSNEENQQKAVQLSINRVRQRLREILGLPKRTKKYDDNRGFDEDDNEEFEYGDGVSSNEIANSEYYNYYSRDQNSDRNL
jgi:hypothetical protein